jgi:ribonuclease VapC
MVIDTSAPLAILQDDPERRAFNEALELAETRSMSTATFVETSIVIESRYGAEGLRDLDLLIAKAAIALVPGDSEQAQIACTHRIQPVREGTSPGGPQLRDCFSCALTKVLGEPLLESRLNAAPRCNTLLTNASHNHGSSRRGARVVARRRVLQDRRLAGPDHPRSAREGEDSEP